MDSVYNSIMKGLSEAVEDAKSEKNELIRKTITIIPVKNICKSVIVFVEKFKDL